MDNERSLAKEITEGFEALQSMRNNEPVAWMQVHYKDNKPTKFSKVQTWEDDVPLYTHPVKEVAGFFGASEPVYPTVKELTDEEIMSEWEQSKDEVDFARAILRKAQEK